jgi:phage host-nuclease inhibitor protein Gam
LYKDAKYLYDYLKNSKVKEESKKMDKNLFKLSDSAKCDLLWDALNTEADSYTIVCDIYDEYAIGYDAVNRKYIRAYYTKDDNADSVTINNVEDCYIIDINAAEKAALDALKSLGSYSDIQSKVENSDAEIARITAEYESSAAALQEKIDALTAELESYKKAEDEPKDDVQTDNAKNDDDDEDKKKKDDDDDDKKGDKNSLENSTVDTTAELVSSYEAKLAEKDAEIARLNQVNSDITNEKSELENFKKSVDNEKKTEILNKFSAHLTETQITDYTSKMENYSVEDFEKEVCFAAYQSDASVLTKDASKDSDLIWDNSGKSFETGALALLRKHTGR